MKAPFELKQETQRPYRIWDAAAKKHCIGRNFKHMNNAHDRALLMLRWGKVGLALEVYDITNGSLLGQYVRKAGSISFTKVK